MITVGWLLLGLAIAFALVGAWPVVLLLAIAAGLLAIAGAPTTEREDAWKRNHARPMR